MVDGPPEVIKVTEVGQHQLPGHHLLHHPVGGLQRPQAGLQQPRDVVRQEDLLDLFTEGGRDAHSVLLDVVDDGGVGDVVLLRPPPQSDCSSPTEEKEGENDDQEEEGGSTDEGEDDDDAAVPEGDVREVENQGASGVIRQSTAAASCNCSNYLPWMS